MFNPIGGNPYSNYSRRDITSGASGSDSAAYQAAGSLVGESIAGYGQVTSAQMARERADRYLAEQRKWQEEMQERQIKAMQSRSRGGLFGAIGGAIGSLIPGGSAIGSALGSGIGSLFG